ncbi:LLM class F420-dependent oxidoreductase [Actinoplanes sp. NPDC051343]|uniref:LLM class F420-dependent oxidoreductase n=1 Tax=Actinoplanes sp. NPDC051343 TaxID=3363906 RepID=UPI0037928418
MNDFGRYGVWVSRRLWPEDANLIASAAQELEGLGFGSVWIGGSPPDDLHLVESILAATSHLVVGTSIVDIWRSRGEVLAASQHRLDRHYAGRFALGVGSGHAPTAESLGQAYVKPLTKLRDFLTDKLRSVPVEERMIAALGPKALETARELTAGALPYLTPPAHTADARRILGPDRLLIPEQKVFLGTDPAQARTVARRITTSYLALPNYTTMLRNYGFTDDDLAGEGSDHFVDTAVVWGDEAAVRKGVDAHLEAGADHVAIQVLSADAGEHLPLEEWRQMASIFLGHD